MSTIFCTHDVDSMCRALVQQYNALHDALAVSDGYSTNHFHRDVSGIPAGDFSNPSSSALQVSAADAGATLASVELLVNNIQGVLLAHFSDDSAHLKVDAVNLAVLINVPLATDATTSVTLINACQSAYNQHLTQSGVHVASDTVSIWGGNAATDQTSAKNAANNGKGSINDHIESAPSIGRIKLIG